MKTFMLIVASALVEAVILMLIVSAIIWFLSLNRPSVVQFSHSTGECVSVNGDEAGCENMPERYNKEWVK